MQNVIETNKLIQLIIQKKQREFKEQLEVKKNVLTDENIYMLFVAALQNKKAMNILFDNGFTPYFPSKDNEGKSLLKCAMYEGKWNMVLYLLKDKKIMPCPEKMQKGNHLNMSCLTYSILKADITKKRDMHILSILIKNSKCHNKAEKFEKEPPLHTLVLSGFDRHASNKHKDKLIDKIRFLHGKGFDVLAKNREGLNVIQLAQYKLDKLNMSEENHDYFIDCLKEFTVEYEKKVLSDSIKGIFPSGDHQLRL